MLQTSKAVADISVRNMQRAFMQYMGSSFQLMIPNYFMPNGYEADIFCMRKTRYVVEVEIKTSISDMRADFKKSHTIYPKTAEDAEKYWRQLDGSRTPYPEKLKHDCLKAGELLTNRFAFFVPWTLKDKAIEILPKYAGLYVFTERGTVHEHKAPPLLHKRKLDVSHDQGVLANLNWRYLRLWMKE